MQSVVFCLLVASNLHAQEGPVPFTSDRWEISAEESEVVMFQGQQSLKMAGGTALLSDVAFRDGTAEVDISMPGEASGFAYLIFRTESAKGSEVVYVRMHKSGLPDALQYAPSDNGNTAWQLYEKYNAPIVFDRNTWTHLRMEVAGSEARFYINEATEPALVVPDLRRGDVTGALGVHGGGGGPIYFANFRYTTAAQPRPITPEPPVPPNVLGQWEVSESFEVPAEGLSSDYEALMQQGGTDWVTATGEASGIVNLSKYRGKSSQRGAVLARTTIQSSRDQTKALHFGYSDDVVVFLNGKPVYAGVAGWRSRYMLFQGFVTADDVLYLDLNEGDNELVFAVYEVFGGWGLIAQFDDTEGMTLP